jgi:P27 family predicted phage terminase small subunit
MGRRKKPHDLKVFEGNPGKEKLKGKLDGLPTPVTREWEIPSWLGKHGRAFHAAHFNDVKHMGKISPLDSTRWFNLCARWDFIRLAEEEILRDGVTIPGRGGEVKKHPATAFLKQQQDLFRGECDTFGISPTVRAQLGLRSYKDEEDTLLADWRPRSDTMID